MFNITPTPDRRHSFTFSLGVSASYRIGTHSKQISGQYGKVKNYDDFDLEPWMIAYTTEIGFGPVRIYGSYSMSTLFGSAKQYPYTIGLRFSTL